MKAIRILFVFMMTLSATVGFSTRVVMKVVKERKSLTMVSMASQDEGDAPTNDESSGDVVSEKKLIEVSSELELPFPAELAYDVYSDLTRQPSWTSWLNSVEYLDDAKQLTKWKIKFMGLSYSWTAVAVNYERPHTIQWKSTSGLKNFGTVKFYPIDDDSEKTIMTLCISFVAPRAASALFKRSKKLNSVVRHQLLESSLYGFRDEVLENDLERP